MPRRACLISTTLLLRDAGRGPSRVWCARSDSAGRQILVGAEMSPGNPDGVADGFHHPTFSLATRFSPGILCFCSSPMGSPVGGGFSHGPTLTLASLVRLGANGAVDPTIPWMCFMRIRR
jgi:hypothetical protein